MPNTNYINFIKKDVDGVITDIYLQDSRIAELLTTDSGKLLTVNASGNVVAVQPHYVTTDTDGKVNMNIDMNSTYQMINLPAPVNGGDAVNLTALTNAINNLGTILTYKGEVTNLSDLYLLTDVRKGEMYRITSSGNEYFCVLSYTVTPPVPAYDNTALYVVGDHVTYQGMLYECIQSIEVPEEFTEAHWKALWEKIGPNAAYALQSDLEYISSQLHTEITNVAETADNAIPRPLNPADEDILSYDATQGKWVAVAPTATGITAVTAGDDSMTVTTTGSTVAVSAKISDKEYNSLQVITTDDEEGLYVASAQSDWTETDTEDPSYIKNKPTLGTASATDRLPISEHIVNAAELPSSKTQLVDANQVKEYVVPGAIYVATTEPTDVDSVFWFKTTDGLLYHRGEYSETTQTYTWEVVGGKVIGVKGNAESTYRTGNVNITSDNIGAIENPATKSNGDYLTYNDATSKWEASSIDLGDIVGETLVVRTARATIVVNEETLYLS